MQSLGNASIFQMTTNLIPMSKVQLVRFTDITSNQTLQAVGLEFNECAVGSLVLAENESNSSLFRIYDHSSEQYFGQNPECCS